MRPLRCSINVKEIEETDVSSLADFFTTLDLAKWTQGQSKSDIENELRRKLRFKGPNSDIWIAVNDTGETLGYCSVHWIPSLLLPGFEGYVSELFVREAERGSGIGSRLLDKIESKAKETGCFRLSLLNLRDRESYQRRFYSKRNWVERTNAANMIKETNYT